MADKALGSLSASVFMDDVRSSFTGGLSYEPDNSNDKWIYSEHDVTTTGTVDMITAGEMFLGTATACASGDKIKWIAIKHTGTTDGSTACASTSSILVTHTAATPAHGGSTSTAGILIEPNELFIAKLPLTTVADLHGIVVSLSTDGTLSAGSGNIRVQIAALLDDVA